MSSYPSPKTTFLPQNETEHQGSGCLVGTRGAALEQRGPKLTLGLSVPVRLQVDGLRSLVSPPSRPASKFITKFITKLVLFDTKQTEVKHGEGLLTARRREGTASFQNASAKPKDRKEAANS